MFGNLFVCLFVLPVIKDLHMHDENDHREGHQIQKPLTMTDDYDDDDGGSLAEYLDKLRNRRLRQRKAFQIAVREKQEKILADADEHREIEAAQNSPYIPAVYRGVKGFFVPQTSIAMMIGSAPSHLRRPRQRKPHQLMSSATEGGRQTMILSPSWVVDAGQNGERRKDEDIVGRGSSKSVAAAVAGQWADLVRHEVRHALDEYDEIYRVSEQLKMAAVGVKPFIFERDEDYWIK